MSAGIREQSYSAQVELSLQIDGMLVDVEQVNGRRLTLRGDEWPQTDTTEATLIIKVDGHIKRREIVLFHGLNGSRYVDFM